MPAWAFPCELFPVMHLDLKRMEPDAARALLLQTAGRATRFSVLGWRLPERNIDFLGVAFVRLFASLCRWPHRAMLAAGGIEGLLAGTLLIPSSTFPSPISSDWQVIQRIPCTFGAATFLIVEKIEKIEKKD